MRAYEREFVSVAKLSGN